MSYTDLCYGYMAFWRRCLPDLNVDCSGFEVETLLTVRAAQADLEIAEVPSVERNRIYGESNLRPIRDGLRVMRTILSERFGRREPKASWDIIASEIVHHHARAESGSAVLVPRARARRLTRPTTTFHRAPVIGRAVVW